MGNNALNRKQYFANANLPFTIKNLVIKAPLYLIKRYMLDR
ncbi:MAG: hypothetical protein MEPRV_01832 [Providencia sp.]|nr:hypothetical protein RB151_022290 [Providencia rettgeri]